MHHVDDLKVTVLGTRLWTYRKSENKSKVIFIRVIQLLNIHTLRNRCKDLKNNTNTINSQEINKGTESEFSACVNL